MSIYQEIFDCLRLVDDQDWGHNRHTSFHFRAILIILDPFEFAGVSERKNCQYPKRSRSIRIFGSMVAVFGLQHPKSRRQEKDDTERKT